jgi:predicted transcriptional regulator
MSLREAARRVNRGVKAVHRDAQALLAIGLLEKTGAGKLVCPFAEIKVNFVLRPPTASRAV